MTMNGQFASQHFTLQLYKNTSRWCNT